MTAFSIATSASCPKWRVTGGAICLPRLSRCCAGRWWRRTSPRLRAAASWKRPIACTPAACSRASMRCEGRACLAIRSMRCPCRCGVSGKCMPCRSSAGCSVISRARRIPCGSCGAFCLRLRVSGEPCASCGMPVAARCWRAGPERKRFSSFMPSGPAARPRPSGSRQNCLIFPLPLPCGRMICAISATTGFARLPTRPLCGAIPGKVTISCAASCPQYRRNALCCCIIR